MKGTDGNRWWGRKSAVTTATPLKRSRRGSETSNSLEQEPARKGIREQVKDFLPGMLRGGSENRRHSAALLVAAYDPRRKMLHLDRGRTVLGEAHSREAALSSKARRSSHCYGCGTGPPRGSSSQVTWQHRALRGGCLMKFGTNHAFQAPPGLTPVRPTLRSSSASATPSGSDTTVFGFPSSIFSRIAPLLTRSISSPTWSGRPAGSESARPSPICHSRIPCASPNGLPGST